MVVFYLRVKGGVNCSETRELVLASQKLTSFVFRQAYCLPLESNLSGLFIDT